MGRKGRNLPALSLCRVQSGESFGDQETGKRGRAFPVVPDGLKKFSVKGRVRLSVAGLRQNPFPKQDGAEVVIGQMTTEAGDDIAAQWFPKLFQEGQAEKFGLAFPDISGRAN